MFFAIKKEVKDNNLFLCLPTEIKIKSTECGNMVSRFRSGVSKICVCTITMDCDSTDVTGSAKRWSVQSNFTWLSRERILVRVLVTEA
jgi:hypothetical protein